MAERRLDATQVVWDFAPGLTAAHTVAAGEVFVVETRDALDGVVQPGMVALPPIERANPATGPIAVQDVQPGQVLAVDILRIDVAPTGYLTLGGRPRFFSQQGSAIELAPGVRVPLAPMVGTIGVMPAEGSFSTKISGDYGGNMDTRDVAAGATLYLMAQVPGGLLALGDVHACQGDGESCGQGIETAADVWLRVRVLSHGLSARPYLVRGGELMVIVTADTLEAAARAAVEETAQALVRHSDLSYDEARMLLGQAGDLRISQIVNPLKTVRMAVPLALVPWREPLPL